MIHAGHVIKYHKQRTKSAVKLKPEEIAEILEKAKVCAICGKRFLTETEKTLDHIKPCIFDGELSKENVQVLCLPCNCRKDCRAGYIKRGRK